MIIMYFAWLWTKKIRPRAVGSEASSTRAWLHDVVDVNTVNLKTDEHEEEEDGAVVVPKQSFLRTLYSWLA